MNITEKKYKITPHTNQTIRAVADDGYHFETLNGEYLGNVVYDGLGVRVEDKYKIVQDTIKENDYYLKPFN